MKTPRLLRSTTFRLTLVYLCLFSSALLVVLGIVYWHATTAVSRQINATIDAEITALAEQFNQRGLVGLIRAVERRSDPRDYSGGLYLLVDQNYRPLSGNLTRWPDEAVDVEGWVTFPLELPSRDGSVLNFGRARVFQLGRYRLLVGHDVQARAQIAGVIRDGLIWALVAAVGISLLGGMLVSRFLFRRIDSINATSREIMAGDLGRRVPVSGRNDEFDEVAGNLNGMLDQIEQLIGGMRQVSDNIAHDLRSPLARLRSRLEVALMKELPSAEYRAVIEETIAEADQLLRTFNSLLAIAQVESGVLRERFEAVECQALLRDVAELYEPLADDRGLELDLRLGEPARIQGDRNLLFQALSNLVDNAIKFSAPGGRIVLAQLLDGAHVILRVTDQGPGIPPEERDKVVRRFYRVEQSRHAPGSGLGLSLVAAVVALHGGRLELADNEPGRHPPGLRVDFVLPGPEPGSG